MFSSPILITKTAVRLRYEYAQQAVKLWHYKTQQVLTDFNEL